MGTPAISVEGVGKKYRIGRRKSGELRQSFSNFLNYFKLTTINHQPLTNEFWALKDISFEVKQGEAVGIIGRNGAGKSTLLKVLSRITKPTTGRFEINGRVSSLLEVGTGFHPELTGRENIYLNGTILGMRRAEINSKFDEIIAFSGVEEFIDTPVKHYSSGMKVRLAFSVAAHLEPEILIIDEVLAVGDAEFQKKCLGKMEDVTGQGRTVLFVSHNMGAIKQLCNNGILLNKGKIVLLDEIKEVVNDYSQLNDSNNLVKNENLELYSSEEVDLLDFRIYDKNKLLKNEFSNADEVNIAFEVFVKRPISNFRFGIEIEDQYSTKILSSYHNDLMDFDFGVKIETGLIKLVCEFPPFLFNEGSFYINLLLGVHNERWVFNIGRIAHFKINFQCRNQNILIDKRNGPFAPILNWKYLRDEKN